MSAGLSAPGLLSQIFVVERQFAESFDPDDDTLRLVRRATGSVVSTLLKWLVPMEFEFQGAKRLHYTLINSVDSW